ncbi:ABC transporter permease [Rhizobium leguminosarum]|uniref:ABC transporter permease n=1 Tax=Rhizobium leguminosarum TaxID=384 RepID=UPI001C989792|nr:ABC transporter permease [Rhizobium leguminosarum]
MSTFLQRVLKDRILISGVSLLLIITFVALLAPLLVAPPQIEIARRLIRPSFSAPFGTDRMGSDLLASVIWGARSTLLIATATATVGVIVGVPIGLVAGYYRNWLCDCLMKISDVFLSLPQIMAAIAITQALGPSIQSVVLALSLTYWPFWARLVYAETRSVRNEIFVQSAAALGASPMRIMILHILPAIASSIVVRTSIGIGATILSAATLGFLGLGAPPPSPEWGRMIAESREYLPQAWWYPLAPGSAIFVTVLAFYLLGDGLRDALDPRLEGGVTKR